MTWIVGANVCCCGTTIGVSAGGSGEERPGPTRSVVHQPPERWQWPAPPRCLVAVLVGNEHASQLRTHPVAAALPARPPRTPPIAAPIGPPNAPAMAPSLRPASPPPIPPAVCGDVRRFSAPVFSDSSEMLPAIAAPATAPPTFQQLAKERARRVPPSPAASRGGQRCLGGGLRCSLAKIGNRHGQPGHRDNHGHNRQREGRRPPRWCRPSRRSGG